MTDIKDYKNVISCNSLQPREHYIKWNKSESKGHNLVK